MSAHLAKWTLAFLSAVLPADALAADIAGNDGWMPLMEAVEKYGIDPGFIDLALDAGGDFVCIRTAEDNKRYLSTLSGWFVADRPGWIVTDGHIYYDENGTRRDDFNDCFLAANRDVFNSPGRNDYRKLKIDPDILHHLVGGPDPKYGSQDQDRALIPLVDGTPADVTAFVDEPAFAADLNTGSTVFLLSGVRAFHPTTLKGGVEPMLQKCTVLAPPSPVGSLTRVVAGCDWHRGVSASRVFVPDAVKPSMLHAVGILVRGREKDDPDAISGVDGLPPDPEGNAAILLITDAAYYHFQFTGDDLPESYANAGFSLD
jgi:hypothetical protein